MKQIGVQRNIQFSYILNDEPPRVEAVGEGIMGKYVMYLNGVTFLAIPGVTVPLQTCPFPEEVLKAQRIAGFRQMKTPVLIAIVTVLSLVLFRAIVMGMDGPDAELTRAYIDMYFLWATIAPVGVISIGVLAYCVRLLFNSAHIVEHAPQSTKMIGAGSPDVSPDILVVSDRADNGMLTEFLGRSVDAKYIQRLNDAIEAQGQNQLIIVLIRAQDIGHILHPDNEMTMFRRNSLVEDLPGWRSEISPGKESFYGETWNEFELFVSLFASHFRAWSASAKMNTENPISNFKSELHLAMKRITTTAALFALCFVSLFAQPKSVRVREYLGERYLSVPEGGKTIEFYFTDAVLPRVSDGKKSYKELLQSPVGFRYSDSDAGDLRGVYLDKVLLPKQSVRVVRNEATSAQPIKPMFGGGDSLTTAQRLDVAKGDVDKFKAEMWGIIAPLWAFIMYVFTGLALPVMACLAIILFYIAKSAAGESIVNLHGVPVVGRFMVWAHQQSAAGLIFLIWIGMVILLISLFMNLVYRGISMWGIIGIMFPAGYFASKLTNWIVPNMPIIRQGGGNPNQKLIQ
jgi:hypothetical protein